MRLYAAYAQAAPCLAVAAIVLGLVGAWTGCYLLGGSQSAGPHLFYVPIVLAAVRFTWPTTISTALAAGLVAGPLLPADVSADLSQEPSAWLLRLGMFAAIASFLALLVEGPEETLRSRLQDAAASARLQRALKGGSIEIFYQPIYRLGDDRLAGVEALARWRQSDDRYASPGSFIPAAERTGAIVDLDAYMLRHAVRMARDWAISERPISISVNLSATTLARPDVVSTVASVLEEVGLAPQLLQLEITESALIEDLPMAIDQVEALRSLGVKVAIDDFGSGQASVSYLQSFPVDVVKLDRCIVTAATIDDRSRRLLEGVIHMCDLLDLDVVAEGVEFADQLELLRRLGVQMAQGFLLGRPAPADSVRALLSDRPPDASNAGEVNRDADREEPS